MNRLTPEQAGNASGLVGDVDFAGAAEVASAITPVPGGVGPMTIALPAAKHAAGGAPSGGDRGVVRRRRTARGDARSVELTMRLRRVRLGELLALVGGACVVVSLFKPWYEGPSGTLDAWDTFGPAMALHHRWPRSPRSRSSRARSPSTAPRCRSRPRCGRVPLGLIATDRRARAGCSSDPITPRPSARAHGSRSPEPSRSCSAPGSRCATNTPRCMSRRRPSDRRSTSAARPMRERPPSPSAPRGTPRRP